MADSIFDQMSDDNTLEQIAELTKQVVNPLDSEMCNDLEQVAGQLLTEIDELKEQEKRFADLEKQLLKLETQMPRV